MILKTISQNYLSIAINFIIKIYSIPK